MGMSPHKFRRTTASLVAIWGYFCYSPAALACNSPSCQCVVGNYGDCSVSHSGATTPISPATSIGPFHIGLDFITTSVATNGTFLAGFEPFSLTDPSNNFVSQGAFSGFNKVQIERSIVLAVETAFREITSTSSAETAAIVIHHGRVPQSLHGRRLNVIMGQSANPNFSFLGESQPDSYNNTEVFLDDEDVAAIYMDEIDRLGRELVRYDAFDKAINAIAGTTAHEIGHIFGAPHVPVPPNASEPYPLMAIESTGLPTTARTTKRTFGHDWPAEAPMAQFLLNNAATTPKGDFNMDGAVNGIDIGTLITQFGRADALLQEGDANGDHRVNGLDVGWLISNWTAGSPAMLRSLSAPEPATGAAGVLLIAICTSRRSRRIEIAGANNVRRR